MLGDYLSILSIDMAMQQCSLLYIIKVLFEEMYCCSAYIYLY